MDNKLTKSLTDLIDETLMELDELRKSRFAASEIHIEGPGAGIDGKPSNGDLHAKKEDKDKDEEDDKDMDKAEGTNRQADPDGGHHKMDKAEGTNRQADPDGGHHQMDKAEDKDKKDKDKKDKDAKGGSEHEAEERQAIGKLANLADMKKSLDASESLMKNFVEQRVAPLEEKLSTILDLVNKIADQPVAPRGTTARTTPLLKSGGEGYAEPLTKSQVASKLFELKKSGTRIDSLDITKAEMGQDLQQIVKKYEIS